MREREREKEKERGRVTGRGRGRGRSRLHAGSPTWDSSWVPRITAWAEGGAKQLNHQGCPKRGKFFQ